MLNLYDINKYKKLINILKRYSEIVCYFYKDNNTKYVNTFLLIEKEQKKGNKMTKIERIEKICDEYAVIIDRLTNEQITAKLAISYNMINPFNNYRIYK